MLRISKKARLAAPPAQLQGCTCFLRPFHPAAPLASQSLSTSAASRGPTLAERIAARRGTPTAAEDPPPVSSRWAASDAAPTRPSPRLPSIDNTTPQIQRLVNSALSSLPHPAGSIPLPDAGAEGQLNETQKRAPRGQDLQRAKNAEAGKGEWKKRKAANEKQNDKSKKGPRHYDNVKKRTAVAEEVDPLTLEQQKIKIEARLELLRRRQKPAWDALPEEDKERAAWKMEMSVKAKERNEIIAEEKAKAARKASIAPLSTLFGVTTSSPPTRPPALPQSESTGLPRESRRGQPDYQHFEDLARERHETRRKHNALELASQETKLEQNTERIKAQQALDAIAALDPSARRKIDPSERAPTPSLLTEFAEKLSLSPDIKAGKSTARGEGEKTKEELAGDLNKVLPTKELARAAGVPFKGPARQPRHSDRLAAQEEASVASSSPALSLSSHPHQLSSTDIPFTPLPRDPSVPIAKLSHGLTRVLFNPGVHFLRDPRSGVYNFPRRALEGIPPVEQFEGDKMPEYVTSSKDAVLGGLAMTEGKAFVGSTSSTVAMLCQIYFWLSKGKSVNLSVLSAQWADYPADFSAGQRLPASVVLHQRDGHYAIDADKSMDMTINLNVLADYGHMMEKLLTTEPDEFDRYLKDSPNPAPSLKDERQAYQYSTTEHMVLRSQLDAHDEHLPNVSFDVKTRGSVAVRQDRLNYVEAAGYDVHKLQGPWESFEREYYDLMRSAFLKYQFQARIGGMDGCFVAYHSTQRFFGFQYVPICDMDTALFGSSEAGDQVFKLSLGFLETLLLKAKECYPGQSMRLTFAAGDVALRSSTEKPQDVLRVFVQPADEDPEVISKDITLLELRGTNYLDGVPQQQVDIQPSKKRDSSDASAEEDNTPVWQVGYSLTSSRTTDSPSSTEASTVPPAEILRLYQVTRDFQGMFSSLTLPSGVSRTDVVAAAQRQASLAASGEATELDPSDLAVRFPMQPGMDYKTRPSWAVQELRVKAREGKKRNEEKARQEEEGEGQPMVEIQSTKKTW